MEWPSLDYCHDQATESAIGENELMDNEFEEAPSPSHHR